MKKAFALATCTLAAALAGTAYAQQGGKASETVERAIHVCNACHGEGGNSVSPQFPKLAGQQPLYLAEQLKQFRSQKRSDSSPQAYMWGVSALLDDGTIQGLAEYYATQKPVAGKPGPKKLMDQGRQIFEQGIPAKKLAACTSCHGENGEGASVFPRIAGQHADYIVRQLNEFGTKLRPHGVIMAERVASKLSPEEKRAVAVYLQSK